MLTHHDPIPLHVYTDSGRFYSIDGQNYPGVGTILTATESAQQQEFWHQYRALPTNAAYCEQSRSRGKLFHAAVEHYFKTGDYRLAFRDADESAIAKVLPYWQSIQDILPHITNIQLIESAVWHEVGHYAGTVDMVCNFNGVPCILDWKTATRPKKAEWAEQRHSYQLAAYCACVNRMYGTCIKHGVIVVALPDTKAQLLQFSLARYWPSWLNRLATYWSQQTTALAAQALEMIRSEYRIILR